MALTGSRSRAGGARRAWQLVLGALSWVGFALLWLWQLEVYVPATWLYSICLIGIILGLWIVFTIGWVSWNRNIYSRRHRRTTPVRMEVGFEQDSLGRPIVASGGIRAAEGQIVVRVDEAGAKRYEPAKRRLLPRLPSVRELLPDWDAIPVTGGVGGNGAGANGNGHAYANGYAYANGNGSVYAHGNGPGYANGNGNVSGQIHANGQVHANGNGHAQAAAYANGSGSGQVQANGNGRAHAVTYANGHAHANGHPYVPAHANGNGRAAAPAHTNGNGYGRWNGHPHPSANGHANGYRPDGTHDRVRERAG